MSLSLWSILILLIIVWIYKNYIPAPKNSPPGNKRSNGVQSAKGDLVNLPAKNQWAEKDVHSKEEGPWRLPFIGSYLQVLWIDYYRPHVAFLKLAKRYNSPIINYGMGGFNVIVANDLASCRETFLNPALQGRLPAYPALIRTYGEPNGLFGDDGERWLILKRNSLRAMRDLGFGRRSDHFESSMEEELRSLVDRLSAKNGEPVILPHAIAPTAFNLSTSLVHGTKIPETDTTTLQKFTTEALKLLDNTNSTGRLLALWPWIRHFWSGLSGNTGILESARAFSDFVKDSYQQHQKDFDPTAIRDLMDYYIQNQNANSWTENQLLTASMDFIFPNVGIAVILSFALAYLVEHPKYLRKCKEEIDNVVGKGRLPHLNDRSSLLTVEAVIKETLRFQSLVPLGITHRATEDTTLGGFYVPKDSVVITNLHGSNLDPNVWKNPELFNPERFLEKGSKDPSLQFGVGKRVCAGETFTRQNLFLILSTILQNFDVMVATPLDPANFKYGLATAPNPDFSVRFIPCS